MEINLLVKLKTELLLFLCFTTELTGTIRSSERRLFDDLLTTNQYAHMSRPVRNASSTVVINLGVSLNQILDLDEKHQILTTVAWIYEEWYDENLQWDPDDYDGLRYLIIPPTRVWFPDIFIFNTAAAKRGYVNVTYSNMIINHKGHIKWMVPVVIKSACAVDVTYFPYDRQECYVQFGSWVYDYTQVDLRAMWSVPDLAGYIKNNEFDLLQVSLKRFFNDENLCPGDERHPVITLYINIRRKSLYYDYLVIAPTLMLCVLTVVTFLLPTHCGEKINIGLTVFLTLYVLQLMIADNVPDSNQTPLLGVFLFLVMTLNSISLIMATLVMNIKKRADRHPCGKVPPWLLWLSERVLRKFTITRLSDWQHAIVSCDEPSSSASQEPQDSLSDTISQESDIENAFELEKIGPSGDHHLQEDQAIQRSLLRTRSYKISCIRDKKDFVCLHDTLSVSNRHLRYEWMFVAEVVDKFSFFVYVVVMSVTVMTTLILVPSFT